jgi:RimJ/RimL family protein N-acetyltransferase
MTPTPNWQPTLADALVKLIPLVVSDDERLYAVAADPLIWEQHPARERYKREVFQSFFDDAIAGGMAFLILDAQTDEVIGSTRYYDYKPDESNIAIGYTFVSRAYWGKEHNRACKKLLLDYAFEYVETVLFHIGKHNLRSQKAIQKIGAVLLREYEREFSGMATPQLHQEWGISKVQWMQE